MDLIILGMSCSIVPCPEHVLSNYFMIEEFILNCFSSDSAK